MVNTQLTVGVACAQSKFDPVPFLLEAVARALEKPPSQYSKYDVLQARLLSSINPQADFPDGCCAME